MVLSKPRLQVMSPADHGTTQPRQYLFDTLLDHPAVPPLTLHLPLSCTSRRAPPRPTHLTVVHYSPDQASPSSSTQAPSPSPPRKARTILEEVRLDDRRNLETPWQPVRPRHGQHLHQTSATRTAMISDCFSTSSTNGGLPACDRQPLLPRGHQSRGH
jgi:hypothetical protein